MYAAQILECDVVFHSETNSVFPKQITANSYDKVSIFDN